MASRQLSPHSRRRTLAAAVAVLLIVPLGILAPVPTPVGADSTLPTPVNDDFAAATDLSAVAIPDYADPLVTTEIQGDTTGSTLEPGEEHTDETGSVWYRYTAGPGGFAGQLGFRITPGFWLDRMVAGNVDPLNPGRLLPSLLPGQVDRLTAARGNDVVPFTVFPNIAFVRMEPGHTVWFRVSAQPYQGDGPFTLELFRAPVGNDGVALAWDVWNGTPFADNSGWGGDGTTHQVTPDAPGAPSTAWFTHVFDRSGTFRVQVASEDAKGLASTRPVGLKIYRAPSTAEVADVASLGAPVASATGGLTWTSEFRDDQSVAFYVSVEQWVTGIENVPITPGRYYIAVEQGADGGSFYSIGDSFRASGPPPPPPPPDTTPPTVTITGTPTGITQTTSFTAQLTLSEPVAELFCTLSVEQPDGTVETNPAPCNGTTPAGTSVAVPFGPILDDGVHTFTAWARDPAGLVGPQSSVSWDVQVPPTATITAPSDGAEYLAAAVPGLAYTCADNGTVGGVEVVVDGQPAAGPGLPTGLGGHTVEVTCVDLFGNEGTTHVSYTVVPPPPPRSDQVWVSVTGGATYQAAGPLVLGNIQVTRNGAGQITSITGGGTFTSPGQPTGNIVFSAYRFSGVWFGTVRIRNTNGLWVVAPLRTAPTVNADGTVSGSGNGLVFNGGFRAVQVAWSFLDVR
jgi:hypothetical protein